MTATIAKRQLQGVEVDATGQPLKAWEGRVDLRDDRQLGAYEAWHGKRSTPRYASPDYKLGRKEQMDLLPKKSNGRVAWGFYAVGAGWCLRDGYISSGSMGRF